MPLYEIYCTRHSQIIDAEDLLNAVKIFGKQNPTEEIIGAESIKHRIEEAKNISFNTPVIGSVPLHKCKWCGVEVTTPDDNCYLNPN
jgi:hypothetical protein